MPRTSRNIAREVNEILAATKNRHSTKNAAFQAFQEVQHALQSAGYSAQMADLAADVPAQGSPLAAHELVSQSERHADEAARHVEHAARGVLAAQGTPQFPNLEEALRALRATVASAENNALATKKAFEKRFGKYDPRGVTDRNVKANVRAAASTESPLALVRQALPEVPDTGRFGARKVFVSALWQRVGRKLGMSLAQFKAWLLEQQRVGALLLARADLIGAMDPKLVTSSEIRDRGAVYHFVQDLVTKEAWER